MAQHAAQPSLARPVRMEGSSRPARSASSGIRGLLGEGGERDRAARVAGAAGQVVAVGVDGGAERRGDDLQVGDLRLHLCQLGPGARLQSGLGALAVPVTARVQQAGHLVQGEPSRWAALMTRSTVTASAGYSRCPPRLRGGSASSPRRS